MLKRWTVSEDHGGTLRTASATERGAFEVVSLLDHKQVVKAEVAKAVGVDDPASVIAELRADLEEAHEASRAAAEMYRDLEERFAATQDTVALQGEVLKDCRREWLAERNDWRAEHHAMLAKVNDQDWVADLNENAKTLIEALDGGPAGRPWWVDAGVSYSKLQGLVR